MSESNVILALRAKAVQLESMIRDYEAQLAKARHDLSVINSAFRIFEREGGVPMNYTPGASVRHLFKRDEAWKLCQEALATRPDGLTTRELANVCTAAKGFDTEDAVLRKGMQAALTSILAVRVRRRQLVRDGTRQGATLWRLRSVES